MKPKLTVICVFFLTWVLCPIVGGQVGILPKKDTQLKEVGDEKFRPGDVWTYKTREGEKNSHITVLKIESSPELGIIVHVAVDGIRLANCHGGPEPDNIPHMPFARRALEESVTENIATGGQVPDYQEGYKEWRAAYEKKRAGIYIISVSDAIGVAEETYRKGAGCE